MISGDLLRMVPKSEGKKLPLGQSMFLFFLSTNAFFFVSWNSWDKGVRSKGKGYIPFKMPIMRERIHRSLWNSQLGYGFPASANSIEV